MLEHVKRYDIIYGVVAEWKIVGQGQKCTWQECMMGTRNRYCGREAHYVDGKQERRDRPVAGADVQAVQLVVEEAGGHSAKRCLLLSMLNLSNFLAEIENADAGSKSKLLALFARQVLKYRDVVSVGGVGEVQL